MSLDSDKKGKEMKHSAGYVEELSVEMKPLSESELLLTSFLDI